MDTAAKRALKMQAHHLKPVVLLGAKGVTEAVIAETNVALLAHELIKVKVNGAEREDRKAMIAQLSEALQAELIQQIGNIAVLYRKKPD